MKILAIETSCDDSGVAIMQSDSKKHRILANVVSSQIKTHAPYGGVVPNLAAREHLKNIKPVLKQAFFEANLKEKDIDLMAVTYGPGLIPSLLVGVNFAKALAYSWQKPIIGINHMEAHIYANFIKNTAIKFPALCLVVSGGHTQLILMKAHKNYRLLGETRDDAAGEAFDKVAKLLGLGFPGGPIISKKALAGDWAVFDLPRPMIHSKDYDFSFSGLKTAVLYEVKKEKKLSQKYINDMAASFQKAAVDVLVYKTIKAAQEFKVKSLMLSGGVAANPLLRQELTNQSKKQLAVDLYIPDFCFCTDNAAMIAAAAYYRRNQKNKHWSQIEANANLRLVD